MSATPTRGERPGQPFPRLPRGGAATSPEARAQAAEQQRRRLRMAMAVAVHRHGYEEVGSSRLAELAGVSKSTLYRHFEGVEGCFVALLDGLVEQAAERIAEASKRGEGLEGRMRAGLESLASIVGANPAYAHLVLVDSLALGAPGTD